MFRAELRKAVDWPRDVSWFTPIPDKGNGMRILSGISFVVAANNTVMHDYGYALAVETVPCPTTPSWWGFKYPFHDEETCVRRRRRIEAAERDDKRGDAERQARVERIIHHRPRERQAFVIDLRIRSEERERAVLRGWRDAKGAAMGDSNG